MTSLSHSRLPRRSEGWVDERVHRDIYCAGLLEEEEVLGNHMLLPVVDVQSERMVGRLS